MKEIFPVEMSEVRLTEWGHIITIRPFSNKLCAIQWQGCNLHILHCDVYKEKLTLP